MGESRDSSAALVAQAWPACPPSRRSARIDVPRRKRRHLVAGRTRAGTVMRRKVGQCAVLVAAILGARPALAYVHTLNASGKPIVWHDYCVTMLVHNASPPAPLTPALALQATSAAAGA